MPKAKPNTTSVDGDLPVGLAAPARRALANGGHTRLAQLTKVSEAEVQKLHGIGPNALVLLRGALKALGLSFAAAKGSKG